MRKLPPFMSMGRLAVYLLLFFPGYHFVAHQEALTVFISPFPGLLSSFDIVRHTQEQRLELLKTKAVAGVQEVPKQVRCTEGISCTTPSWALQLHLTSFGFGNNRFYQELKACCVPTSSYKLYLLWDPKYKKQGLKDITALSKRLELFPYLILILMSNMLTWTHFAKSKISISIPMPFTCICLNMKVCQSWAVRQPRGWAFNLF